MEYPRRLWKNQILVGNVIRKNKDYALAKRRISTLIQKPAC